MLAIFGERDTIVNARQSAEVLERALRESGNTDVTVRTFPGADHVIFKSETGGMKEMDRSFFETPVKAYPPEYLETMAEWVAHRTAGNR